MTRKYTEKFLISELHRFVRENGRVPMIKDMTLENGYLSVYQYYKHFGSWNKALESAGLEINVTHEYRIGNETCCKCGCNEEQAQAWLTKGLPKGQVMCIRCYNNRDYMNKNLDKNSVTGFAFITQRIVAKFLGLELKDDCNCSDNFGAKYDLYDKGRYNYINVKGSHLNDNNVWSFSLTNNYIPDTYIFVGFSEDGKHILNGWSIKSTDSLVSGKTGVSITNNYKGLMRFNRCKIDAKKLDNILHQMSQKRKDTKGESCILRNDDLELCNTIVCKNEVNYVKNESFNIKTISDITEENDKQYTLDKYWR